MKKRHPNRTSKHRLEIIMLLFYRVDLLPGEEFIDNSDEFIAKMMDMNTITVSVIISKYLNKKRVIFNNRVNGVNYE